MAVDTFFVAKESTGTLVAAHAFQEIWIGPVASSLAAEGFLTCFGQFAGIAGWLVSIRELFRLIQWTRCAWLALHPAGDSQRCGSIKGCRSCLRIHLSFCYLICSICFGTRSLVLQPLEFSVGKFLIGWRPWIQYLLLGFPNEIGQTLFLLFEVFDFPKNHIFNCCDIIIHHCCSLVVIWIFFINFFFHFAIEFFDHALQFLTFSGRELGWKQLWLLSHGQAFLFINFLHFKMFRLLVPHYSRRAVAREGVQLLAEQVFVVTIDVYYLFLLRVFSFRWRWSKRSDVRLTSLLLNLL